LTTLRSGQIQSSLQALWEDRTYPDGVLIAGAPAVVKRSLLEDEIDKNRKYSENYVQYKNEYLNRKTFAPHEKGDEF
jgi:carbonic anhydrase/acetyltransferase-like protein (isoleucine patch superfamily)